MEEEVLHEPEVVEVQSEEEFLEAVGASGPIMVETKRTVHARKERLLHRVLDGVERSDVEAEAEAMGIERASKVINALSPKEVKMDHTITAMALIGMFPVAKEIE